MFAILKKMLPIGPSTMLEKTYSTRELADAAWRDMQRPMAVGGRPPARLIVVELMERV